MEDQVQDDAAVEEFLREGYQRVVGAVALASGNLDSAEYAVQEAIVRAWECSATKPEIESLERWVVTVALNPEPKEAPSGGPPSRFRTSGRS